eukprot:gene28596-37786_t
MAKQIKPSKQVKLNETSFFLPKLTEAEQTKADELLAMHYYVCGTSFQKVEDDSFKSFVKLLRPDATVPSRKRLANDLLDSTFEKLQKRITLSNNRKMATLSADGSEDCNGRSITNYTEVVEGVCYFKCTLYSGNVCLTAQQIADEWTAQLNDCTSTIVGGTFDNTSTNKAAWALLQNRYPDKFFQGCGSDAVHLIVKSLFSKNKPPSSGQFALVENANAFIKLQELVDECKTV